MKVSLDDKHVARFTFDRPEKSNALDLPAWRRMRQAFATLDESAHVVILTGAGKHFCAGMDLSVFGHIQRQMAGAGPRSLSGGKGETALGFIREIQDCISAIEACPVPVIAAVRGGCIGGGLGIASACDLRYATEDAFFTIKEVDLGIVADIGTLQRLPFLLPEGLLAEMAYTGRRVFGPEAKRTGLINDCYPSATDLTEAVNDIALAVAGKNPTIVRGIKSTLLAQRSEFIQLNLSRVAELSAAIFATIE